MITITHKEHYLMLNYSARNNFIMFRGDIHTETRGAIDYFNDKIASFNSISNGVSMGRKVL